MTTSVSVSGCSKPIWCSGLFPDWFGPPQPDWPANTRPVGFPLWDAPRRTRRTVADEVREFLAAGTPPIAFSPGSANHEAHQFFAAAVDACQRLGRRGILLTKYDRSTAGRVAAIRCGTSASCR